MLSCHVLDTPAMHVSLVLRYESLFEYGVTGDPPSLAPDDPDADLVPQLVTKLVLPLAAHMLGRWERVLDDRGAHTLKPRRCVPPAASAVEQIVHMWCTNHATDSGHAILTLSCPSLLLSLRCWDPLDVRQSAAVAAVVGDLCV
jgi:hypothetical protein